MAIGDYHRQYCARFRRRDRSAGALKSLRKSKGWKTGRTARFEKGGIPWNKGKKLPFNANRARTQFKKGQIAHNKKFVGAERIRQGYVEIRVNQLNPQTGLVRRYVVKHRWLWEKMHGPIPEGMALKCKGDPLNTDPSNWELVSRGLLSSIVSRNYDKAPDYLKPTIMAVAKLAHRLRDPPLRRGDFPSIK